MRTVLQIPLDTSLRKDAEKQALEQGFSSLQEAVRVFLKKLAKGAMGISFEREETVRLSLRAIKRYDKMAEDFRKGKNVYTAKNIDDLMKHLHEDSLS
ncbi:hypothetical protein HYT32_01735 [Candidatus Roizmanbacteria bacterium]|nr:hypothetical protein [Candidatus Roizmanbacteria bacterium]